MADSEKDPTQHREYCETKEDALRHYSPFRMVDCGNCGNWFPDQYRCPCCGEDPGSEPPL